MTTTLDPTSTENVTSTQGETRAPEGDKPSLLDFKARAGKDLPPKKERRTAASTRRTTPSAPRPSTSDGPKPITNSAIVEGIATIYATLGTFASPFLPQTGAALVGSAESIGKAWADAADASPMMRRIAENMLTGNVAVQFLTAHIPVAMVGYAELSERRAAKKASAQRARNVAGSPNIPGTNEKPGAQAA